MAAPSEITPAQLLRLLGTPNAPCIVDVCTPEDFAEDPYLIPTALRHHHDRIDTLIDRLAGRHAVVVCQKGLKLSQGVTAWLRSAGAQAEYLQGGMHGWRAHPDALRIPAAATTSTSLWVTRHRPKIDRIACPWLIRRFVDPDARFLFVAPDQVLAVAERFDAQPFDIEGVPFSHDGPLCTFDTMLRHFELHSPALDTMARIIRAADTNTHDLAPQAAGLLAISVGLSRQYRDDQDQLTAGLALYDALYRWARDGQDEGHDWPTGRRA